MKRIVVGIFTSLIIAITVTTAYADLRQDVCMTYQQVSKEGAFALWIDYDPTSFYTYQWNWVAQPYNNWWSQNPEATQAQHEAMIEQLYDNMMEAYCTSST